jgi:hypothetical protein
MGGVESGGGGGAGGEWGGRRSGRGAHALRACSLSNGRRLPPRAAPMSRPRLAELVGLGWVSDSALQKILKRLQSQGALSADACVSRGAIHRAGHALPTTATPYGPPVQELQLPLESGGTWAWPCFSPFALLHALCAESPALRAAFAAAVLAHPPARQPWRLVVYVDEAGSPPSRSAIVRASRASCHGIAAGGGAAAGRRQQRRQRSGGGQREAGAGAREAAPVPHHCRRSWASESTSSNGGRSSNAR